MKYIKTLTLSLFVGMNVMAQEMPESLKGTKNQLIDASGKVIFSCPSEDCVIVWRKKKKKTVIVASAPVIEKKAEQKKYSVSVLFGAGLLGLESSKKGSTVSIQERTQPVFGLALSRMISEEYSLGGQILSNRTWLISGGYHFDVK